MVILTTRKNVKSKTEFKKKNTYRERVLFVN